MEQGLAADFFLISHDEFAGRMRTGQDTLVTGLLGAAFADLILNYALTIDIDSGRIVPTGQATARLDDISRMVLDRVSPTAVPPQDGADARQLVAAGSARTVQGWVKSGLGEEVYSAVAQGLVAAKVVRWDRGWFGRKNLFPAEDLMAARRPRATLARMVDSPKSLKLRGAVTLALLASTGLEAVMEPEADRDKIRGLAAEVVPTFTRPLAALLDGVDAAVAAGALSSRRGR